MNTGSISVIRRDASPRIFVLYEGREWEITVDLIPGIEDYYDWIDSVRAAKSLIPDHCTIEVRYDDWVAILEDCYAVFAQDYGIIDISYHKHRTRHYDEKGGN